MIPIERIQAQLRASAQFLLEAVPVPPFTCFFNPDSLSPFANYAIPDAPAGGDLGQELAAVRATFAARNRRPRFEFLQAFAPDLAASLEAAGFIEENRIQLMLCDRETFRPALPVPGLTITQVDSTTPLDTWQRLDTVQRRSFGEDATPLVTELEAEQFRNRFGHTPWFLAWLDGQPVCTGCLMVPYDGLIEVAGIGTLATFRRRGIATALTTHAVQLAFDQGLEVVFLTAANAEAGRVYERIGFRPYGLALVYSGVGE
ncbi:MAG: GNAT family N-acetyltransferase [Chloroflexi bacterium]|nr:GNAT family N-acetyltransferase [Chloroflexota bacterium]MCI0578300.1 GNAT family N-acetyltransferase [Chloroflexota bacterium]MCI0648751.1 GNAT family N-acetyltransferase [Chloroflexota bacterium]MCI0732116.1 GNAT family N-acetyltransferase [Chloroflexota bacterium]